MRGRWHHVSSSSIQYLLFKVFKRRSFSEKSLCCHNPAHPAINLFTKYMNNVLTTSTNASPTRCRGSHASKRFRNSSKNRLCMSSMAGTIKNISSTVWTSINVAYSGNFNGFKYFCSHSNGRVRMENGKMYSKIFNRNHQISKKKMMKSDYVSLTLTIVSNESTYDFSVLKSSTTTCVRVSCTGTHKPYEKGERQTRNKQQVKDII